MAAKVLDLGIMPKELEKEMFRKFLLGKWQCPDCGLWHHDKDTVCVCGYRKGWLK